MHPIDSVPSDRVDHGSRIEQPEWVLYDWPADDLRTAGPYNVSLIFQLQTYGIQYCDMDVRVVLSYFPSSSEPDDASIAASVPGSTQSSPSPRAASNGGLPVVGGGSTKPNPQYPSSPDTAAAGGSQAGRAANKASPPPVSQGMEGTNGPKYNGSRDRNRAGLQPGATIAVAVAVPVAAALLLLVGAASWLLWGREKLKLEADRKCPSGKWHRHVIDMLY